MTRLKTDFDRDGYVVVRNFLNAKKLKEVIENTNKFISEKAINLPREIVYFEDISQASSVKQVQKLYEHESFFNELATSRPIVELAEQLLGGKAVLKNMQYFNKLPKIGRETPPHQDGYYFMIQPQQAVTMWLSLGHADAKNGAVSYIPGSHKKGLREHGKTQTLGFSQSISDWNDEDRTQEVQMEAEAGDLLVHHSLTIHRANNNRSEFQRRSLGFIFYREDAVRDEKAYKIYKENLNQDLIRNNKI